MARIYQIEGKKGTAWYADYSLDGRRIRKRLGRSKRLAELALADIEVKLERKELGFQFFSFEFGLLQQEASAADDDLTAMLDVACNRILHAQHTRLATVDGKHVDREAGLQRRMFVQIVQDDLAARITLEIDNDASVFV